jgi:GT2 family glycosyltransferase/glycosyltransferase involved in cell wall biosynthesis
VVDDARPGPGRLELIVAHRSMLVLLGVPDDPARYPEYEARMAEGSVTMLPGDGAPTSAFLNSLARRASREVLVVAREGHDLAPDALERLEDEAARTGGLVLASAAEGDTAQDLLRRFAAWVEPVSHGESLLAALERTAPGAGAAVLEPPSSLVHAWAMPVAPFTRLDGLDPSLDGIADLDDLAARAAAAGVSVRSIRLDAWRPHHARPCSLTAGQRRFLALRNRLATIFRVVPTARLGEQLAFVTALAIREAGARAAIDPARLRFGGRWGGAGLLARLAGAAGEQIRPRDQAGTLVPLLALDAFLDELIAGTLRRPREASPAITLSPLPGPTAQEAPGAGAAAARARGAPPSTASSTVAASGAVPRVSVVIASWNGRAHLEPCLSSLLASRYPEDRFEIVLVDNGSTDGSLELVRARFPGVITVALPENRGFTGGNVAGVERATGDVLVFLNNDMRVEPDAVPRLVASLDDEHPCAAARVLSWDGTRIDFISGTVNFEARGFQEHYGRRLSPELAASVRTFFPNGGAFAITRDAYERAGGFDPAFFAYYDDVDLGWGVRAAGHDIRIVADAVVYHRHGATSRRQPRGQKQFLMDRNALLTVLKRYEEPTLRRVLAPVLLLGVRRLLDETRLHRAAPACAELAAWSVRCRRAWPLTRAGVRGARASSPSRAASAAPLRAMPAERLAALAQALEAVPRVRQQREALDRARRAPDRALVPLFGRALDYTSSIGSFKAAHDALVEALQLTSLFKRQPRVLLITHEPLRANLSGPGIRVLELGRVLAREARVTIATPFAPEIADEACALAPYSFDDPRALRRLAEQADVLVVQGFTLHRFPFLTQLDVPVVVDLYCPFTIEHLEMRTGASSGRVLTPPESAALERDAASVLAVQQGQLRAGDFFICASERQRDFWIGALHSEGRVNPATYAADPTLRRLIDVVPFGVPASGAEEAARRAGAPERALKGRVPGIGPDDRVLIWGGSILDWQDPEILVRAVARAAERRADLRLFFMGTRHPNPQVSPMQAVGRSMALARELGVLDRHVFFNEWVPYERRAAYLLDADIGVSTHRDHLETRLSFRTRMLDYLWAGLPIVCTEGDHFADLVRARGLGRVVPPGDEEALAGAIVSLLGDEGARARCRARVAAVADESRWSRVAAPLARYCEAPWFAADREPAVRAMRAHLARSYRVSKWMKRSAMRLGVSEVSIERLKDLGPVRAAMKLRNRVAIARARARGGA